jgi:hypothetical protein
MKESYFRTPRTLAECQFQTGYRCAEPRDFWAEAGHLVLNLFCAVALVVLAALLILGVL